MRTRGPRIFRVFPELIDAQLTRREGRRISQSEGVDHPLSEEIRLAAEHMGYSVTVKEGSYPRRHWDGRNIVLIEKKDVPKTKLLGSIAKDIKSFVRPALEAQRREEEQARQRKKYKPKKKPTYRPTTTRKKDGKVRRRR